VEVSQIQKTIFKIELKFHGKKIKTKKKQKKSNQESNNIGLNNY
jgi:hypothetical protein